MSVHTRRVYPYMGIHRKLDITLIQSYNLILNSKWKKKN